MEDDYPSLVGSPAAKAGVGVLVALLIAVVAQLVGFVDLTAAFGSGDDDVIIEDDQASTTEAPVLAFEEDESTSLTTTTTTAPADQQEPIGEVIELNPVDDVDGGLLPADPDAGDDDDAVGSGDATAEDEDSPGADVGDNDSADDPEDQSSEDDPEAEELLFDENGDPIPVPDDEQSTENEPVHRTYNDYNSGSS